MIERKKMLELRNIYKKYSGNDLFAVQSVNLKFEKGKIYSLVGESGSGKSTLGKIMGGILPPSSGEVLYHNRNVYPMDYKKRREYLRQVQLILQDGKSALDSKMNIYKSIAESLINFKKLSGIKLKERVLQLLHKMELSEDILGRFPYELSGGQQKRVCIARALSVTPTAIIFDEAVSGLDVTVQKNILSLLTNLHKESEGIYIFITHDMGAALFVSDEIIVMKDGKVLEQADCTEGKPEFNDEYSKLLLQSAFSGE